MQHYKKYLYSKILKVNGELTNGSPFTLWSFFVRVVFQKVIWRAMEKIAHDAELFILYGFSLIIDHSVEIAIAHTQLLVEPVFGLAMLFK